MSTNQVNASRLGFTLRDVEKITEKANARIAEIYKQHNWSSPPLLTQGR